VGGDSQNYRKRHLSGQILGLGISVGMVLLSIMTYFLNRNGLINSWLIIPDSVVSTIARLLAYVALVLTLSLLAGMLAISLYERHFVKRIPNGFVPIIFDILGNKRVSFAQSVWLLPKVESYENFNCLERPSRKNIDCYTDDLTKVTLHTCVTWVPNKDHIEDIVKLSIKQEEILGRTIEQLITHYARGYSLTGLRDNLEKLQEDALRMLRKLTLSDSQIVREKVMLPQFTDYEQRIMAIFEGRDPDSQTLVATNALRSNGIVVKQFQILNMSAGADIDEHLNARRELRLKKQVAKMQFAPRNKTRTDPSTNNSNS